MPSSTADNIVDMMTGKTVAALAGQAAKFPVPRAGVETYGDIEIQMIDVGGQVLRVATRNVGGKEAGRPPQHMFNGIGANLEVGFPFLEAMKHTDSIIFDVPGIGGSPMPKLPYRPSTLSRWA